MSTNVKILAFAGSLRRDSWNKKVVKLAAESARTAGAQVTYLDLKELPMPVYDEDIEREGFPANARTFKGLLRDHDAFLISSPEYNGSITGVLKNSIDWATRKEPNEATLASFQHKVAGIVSASPGPYGAVRGATVVRQLLMQLGVIVVPEQCSIAKVHEAFGADGKFVDAKHQAAIDKVVTRLVHVTAALAAHR